MRHLLINTLFWLIGFSASAQNLTSSPYSRFGSGELNYPGFSRSAALGRLGTAMLSKGNIFTSNPASYSIFDITLYEVGVQSNIGQLQNNTDSKRILNGSIAYLALGFPISRERHIGASFGLMPFSSVGYFVQNKTTSSIGPLTESFEGKGGINKLFVGTGWAPFKFISLGVNGAYLFGNLNNNKSAVFPDTSGIYNYAEYRTRHISDVMVEGGIQLHREFWAKNKAHTDSAEYQLIIGAAGNMKTSMNGWQSLLVSSNQYVVNSFNYYITDTVLWRQQIAGAMVIPATFRVGLTVNRLPLWTAGVEYEMADWSKFSSFNSKDYVGKSSRLSAGFSYQNRSRKLKEKNIFKKMDYRTGIRLERLPWQFNGQSVREVALSTGLGIPLRTYLRDRSMINLTAEWMIRGTTQNQLLKEQFVRLTLGLTFGSRWFDKPRIY